MQRLRILVVEDEEDLRDLYRALLVGHDLVEAATLAEARSVLCEQRFDLVVTDWCLPDGEGGTLLSELHERGDVARRIVHSGLRPERLSELEASAVIHRFLIKPSWVELSRVLAELIALSREPTASTASSISRRSRRVRLEMVAFVRWEAMHDVRRLSTEDVSEQGLSLRSSYPVAVGTRVTVALYLPGGERMRCRGEVRYANPVTRPDRGIDWRVGLQLYDALVVPMMATDT